MTNCYNCFKLLPPNKFWILEDGMMKYYFCSNECVEEYIKKEREKLKGL